MEEVWRNDFPEYVEPQVGLLCGKHAINHILQEGKITWVPVPPDSVLSGTFVDKRTGLLAPDDSDIRTDKNIQLNLWVICDRYAMKQAREGGMSYADFMRQADVREVCDANHQNIPFTSISYIFTILGYETVSGRPSVAGFWNEFRTNLNKPNCLGIILNLGGGHYTAISKFLKSCKNKFAYIDSIPARSPLVYCKTLDDMVSYVRDRVGTTEAVKYVYDMESAYPSVAASRLRRGRGGRRSTRKNR